MSKRTTIRRSPAPGEGAAPADPRQWLAELMSDYRSGRFDALIEGAVRFTCQWPDQVVGWNLLAEGCRMMGRLDDAESACRRALAIDSRSAEACNNLGNVFRDKGDPQAAEEAHRRALSIKPGLVEARYNLGVTLQRLDRLQEAVSAYREAVAQCPKEALYHRVLGMALKERGDLEAARDALEQALSIQPDHAETLNTLGNVLGDLDQMDDAIGAFERALALRPRMVEAHKNLGRVLRAIGEFERAEACFRRALEINPGFSPAWYSLSLNRKFSPGDAEIAAMESLLEQSNLPDEDRLRLHFALGKAYADIGAPADRVFEHYAQGCRLKRQSFDYDVDHNRRDLARIAEHSTRAWLDVRRNAGDPTDAPVFVVGMPRSGTTLVEQILASHACIHGAGERNDLGLLVAARNAAGGIRYPEWLPDLPVRELSLLGDHYRARVIDPAGADRVVDKMPSNFLYLGLIATALPNARIVHVMRNPIDTCLSCFTQLFSDWQPFSYDLQELGRYYRAYADLMEHWRNVLRPGTMLEIRYEDLVADPEAGVECLLQHCDVEWDPACLDFHASRRSVMTASLMQVRQPMYRSSVGRWKHYRDHLNPLIHELGPLAAEWVDIE